MNWDFFECIMNQGAVLLGFLLFAVFLIYGIVKTARFVIKAIGDVKFLVQTKQLKLKTKRLLKYDAPMFFGTITGLVIMVAVLVAVMFGLGYVLYLLGFGGCHV